MPGIHSDEFKRERKVTVGSAPRERHRLAGLSLACSFGFVVPLLPLAAMAMAVKAIGSIKANPMTRGIGTATVAIVLGAVFTVGQALAGVEMCRRYDALRSAPQKALNVGFAGNTTGFRDLFHGRGGTASDAEILAFTKELRARYGGFLGSRPHDDASLWPPPLGTHASSSYVLSFTNGSLRAEADIVFADIDDGDWFLHKLESISVFDPVRGHMVFPGGASLASASRQP